MRGDTNETGIRRFFWVDALRGVAALVIVVFHYHHFYLADAYDRPAVPDISTFPYANLLTPLYSSFAANAVELFWLISGFVFLHVYLRRETGVWPFAVARFARLYPLHFATLLYVAALQVVSMQVAGHWQIYDNNDVRHFILQLFMASNWNNLAHGLSFNGPIWSVSLEIVVYGMFFCAIPLLKKAPIATSAVLSVLAWSWIGFHPFAVPFVSMGVFECAAYFFVGSLLYALRPYAFLSRAMGLAVAGVALFVVGKVVGFDDLLIIGTAIALVSLAAALDAIAPDKGKWLSPLGDISYSVYLVHVPLQMTILLVADMFFDGTRDFANSTLTLPVYLAVSIAVALFVHRWLELPLGKRSKQLLLPDNKPSQQSNMHQK